MTSINVVDPGIPLKNMRNMICERDLEDLLAYERFLDSEMDCGGGGGGSLKQMEERLSVVDLG